MKFTKYVPPPQRVLNRVGVRVHWLLPTALARAQFQALNGNGGLIIIRKTDGAVPVLLLYPSVRSVLIELVKLLRKVNLEGPAGLCFTDGGRC